MRIAAGIACHLVGLYCVQGALGLREQFVFTDQTLWAWWLIAGYWFMNGLAIWEGTK